MLIGQVHGYAIIFELENGYVLSNEIKWIWKCTPENTRVNRKQHTVANIMFMCLDLHVEIQELDNAP